VGHLTRFHGLVVRGDGLLQEPLAVTGIEWFVRHEMTPMTTARREAGYLSPAGTRHTLTEPSALPEAKVFPLGANATTRTPLRWPRNVLIARPVEMSQSFTVRSQLPVASRLPSGEKATAIAGLWWPCSRASSFPEAASQTRTLPSSQHAAKDVP